MNERIGQLAEQAGLLGPGSRVGNSHDAAERFAQLIIGECLSQVDKMRDSLEEDSEHHQALGADWAGLAIARHFGVE